ncbi:hypothetical protein MASR2M54_05100 [Aliarcobacter cryaerophilus]
MLIALVLAKFLTSPFIALHYYLAIVVLTVIFALLLLKNDLEAKINQTGDEVFSFLKHWAFWASIFFMQVSFGGFLQLFYYLRTRVWIIFRNYILSLGFWCNM